MLRLLPLMQGELGTLGPLCPAAVLLPENEDVLFTSHQNQFHVERPRSECTVHTLRSSCPAPGPSGRCRRLSVLSAGPGHGVLGAASPEPPTWSVPAMATGPSVSGVCR